MKQNFNVKNILHYIKWKEGENIKFFNVKKKTKMMKIHELEFRLNNFKVCV